jgi:hypothetical protein
MPDDRPRYLSYLLRLWQVKDRQGWIWQASLESPTTGKRWGFQNIDGLMDFLQGQTQQGTSSDDLASKDDTNE